LIYFVEVTTKCNLRCSFCYNEEIQNKMRMSTETFNKLLDSISPSDDFIIFTGGEALTNRNIFDFIDACKEKGVKYSISTNGWLGLKYWDKFTEYLPENIHLSIDGLAKTHDQIRSSSGLFNKIHELLLKIENSNFKIGVFVQITVGRENLYEANRVIEYLSEFKCVSEIKVTPYYQLLDFSIFDYIYQMKASVGVSSEIVTKNEFAMFIKQILSGVNPTLIVVKPNGYIHPYFGLRSKWDLINLEHRLSIKEIRNLFFELFLALILKEENIIDKNFEYYNINSFIYDILSRGDKNESVSAIKKHFNKE